MIFRPFAFYEKITRELSVYVLFVVFNIKNIGYIRYYGCKKINKWFHDVFDIFYKFS